MAAASSSNSTKDAGAADDDWIAREIATTLHVLSLQSNPLKESPEAAVLAMPVGGGSGGGGSGGAGVSIELQRLEWLPEARTLRLSAFPEPGLTASGSGSSRSSSNCSSGGGGGGLTRAQQLLLAAPITLELFFPESPADPPLCFGSTDAAAMVAERVNEKILPLERSSLLHAVSRITGIIKQEIDSIWPPSADYLRAFHAQLSAHLQAHPQASDLLLSLLSMARPHQNPSVRFPLPRFFYRGAPGKDTVDQPALLAALHAIPPLPTLVVRGDAAGPPPLPFASCVLLHHLFFRSRVALLDPPSPTPTSTPHNAADDEYHRLLADAGITALPPVEQPALAFRVAHAADARFTRPAQRHGTQVGFHGSPPGNFYSIVALGLRNLSGTRGMRNGAVFGEGVYLASRLEVAREFGDWGTKVWPHSAFGLRPPGSDAAAAASSAAQQPPPIFAYQVIALCEFLALDQYTKHLVKKTPASSSSSSAAAAAASTPSRRPGGGGGGGNAPSEYYVVEEDSHLVVRMLLLFKDPAIVRQGRPGAAAAAAAGIPASTGGTSTSGAAAAGLPPPQLPQQGRRQRGWTDHLFALVRAACFVVALVMLLDGLERLLVKRGALHTPAAAGGGHRRPMR